MIRIEIRTVRNVVLAALLSFSFSSTVLAQSGLKHVATKTIQSKSLLHRTAVKSIKSTAATPVIFEDFSKFTAGSEDVPDATEISDIQTGEIPVSYLSNFGWNGAGIFQAGGSCYVDLVMYDGGEDTGFLDSPYLNLSANAGKFTVKLRAKSKSPQGDDLIIGTYNLGSSNFQWESVQLTNAWKEFTVSFDQGIDGTAVEFYSMESPCFLDDIEVSQESATAGLAAPEANPASNITATSFTASWSAVTGATSYLLNVYSYDDTKSSRIKAVAATRNYYLQDEEINGTTVSVEQLNKDLQYYYTVRATDGTSISDESAEIKVEKESDEIKATTLLTPTNVTANGFTARWEAVKGVSTYWFYLFEKYTAPSDQTYTVVDEDFSGVTVGTVANPVLGSMQEILDSYTKASGWEAMFPLYAKGMIGLSDDMSLLPSVLLTPRYDLSANDGKFTVELNATSSSSQDVLSLLKECFDTPHLEASDLRDVTLSTTSKFISTEFQHVNPLAVGGVDLQIYTTGHKTFIDDIKIKKDLKQGDSFSYIYFGTVAKTGKSIESVPVELSPRPGYTYSYGVVVLKPLEVEPYLEFLGYENRMDVDIPNSSINSASADNLKAYVFKDNLHIILNADSKIDVYSISGKLLKSVNGNAGENILPLTDRGIYLVKSGGSVVKIIK